MREVRNAAAWTRAVLAAAACAGPRLVAVAAWPSPPATNYSQLADSLVRHGEFGLAGVKSTYLEPLYPALLASLRFLLGDHATRILVVQALIGAAGGAFLYLLARRLATDRVACIAVALYGLYPYFVRQTASYLAFTLVTTLLLASAYALIRADSPIRAAVCGVWFGLLVLARASMLMTLAAGAMWLAWRRRTSLGLAMLAAALTLFVPWAYRDWRTDGGVLPSRLGENLYVSFSSLALQIKPTDDVDLLVPLAYRGVEDAQRPANVPEQTRQRDLDRRLFAASLHFIAHHPFWAAWLVVRDVPALIDPEVLPVQAKAPTSRAVLVDGALRLTGIATRPFGYELPHMVARLFITIMGLVGFVRRRRQQEEEAMWVLAGTVALLCVVFFPTTRLIEPVAFVGMFYAAIAVDDEARLRDSVAAAWFRIGAPALSFGPLRPAFAATAPTLRAVLQAPAKQHRPNREASPDRREQDEIARLQPPGGAGVRERQRDRARSRVAVLVQIDDHLRRIELEPLGGGFDDSAVRLVRDEQIDVGRRQLVTFEQAAADLLVFLDRELEHGRAVLFDVVQPAFHGLVRRRHPASAGGHAERRAAVAIDLVQEVDDVGLAVGGRRQHHRPGAVSEQHAGRAIGEVDDARHHIGPDRERVLNRAGPDHLGGDRERVGKPGARRPEIESPRMDRAEFRLQIARGAGKDRVGRGRSDHDEANAIRGHPRFTQRAFGGDHGQIRRRHAGIDDVPFADAGALQDPFVARVHHFFEIVIGEDTGGNVGRQTRNLDGSQRAEFGGPDGPRLGSHHSLSF